jgi:integration host factor subunit beta
VNKSELIRQIAKERGLPERRVKEVVDLIFEVMAESLAEGERIEIRGLGSLRVKRKPSRFVKDPKTGIEIFVKERYVPHFKMGKQLKQELNSKK